MSTNEPTLDFRQRYAAYWQRVCASPQRYDLFGALRWIEALCADRDRIGRAAHPRDEPLRLAQAPSLSFSPTMVARATSGAGEGAPARLFIHGFGLFGPNGPMPLHLTEHAREATYQSDGNALSAFADLFHHRSIALFYRAWADAQPTVACDRAGASPFDRYVASLIGRALRIDRAHASTPPLGAMCFFAGHWARHTRNPEGLVSMLAHDFSVPVRLIEHVVQWLPIDQAQRTTLRAAQPGRRLGGGALLGRAVRDGQSSFRLVLGPMSLERYRTFLPDGAKAKRVAEWVREYVGVEMGWTMQLELAADQVPRYALGAREGLGRSVWIGRRVDAGPARDLSFDGAPRSLRVELAMRQGGRAAQPTPAAAPSSA